MLVVPELEKEVELLWELRNMRKVNGSSLYNCYYSQRSIKLKKIKFVEVSFIKLNNQFLCERPSCICAASLRIVLDEIGSKTAYDHNL